MSLKSIHFSSINIALVAVAASEFAVHLSSAGCTSTIGKDISAILCPVLTN